MSDTTDMLWWEPTADVTTGAPMVLFIWGEKRQVFTVERAVATCRDMFAAASAAEADKALLDTLMRRLKLDKMTATRVMVDFRGHRAALQADHGAKPFLRIQALVGARTGKPLVHVHRGSLEAEFTPDQARIEATKWLEVTVASLLDVRIRYTLGDFGFDVVKVEEFMKALAALQPQED